MMQKIGCCKSKLSFLSCHSERSEESLKTEENWPALRLR